MAFRVGQKVICVNPVDDLAAGRIYTITATGVETGERMVDVDGSRFRFLAFFAWRFRPVVERKTDISIFTKMLTRERTNA